MATDIAFALAVLGLLGKRVPLSMRIFLTALAVVDDIGGIIIIALFYSGHIAYQPLLISLAMLALLYAGGKMRVNNNLFYYIVGFCLDFVLGIGYSSNHSRGIGGLHRACPSEDQPERFHL